MSSPYDDLPRSRFWRTGVVEAASLSGLYEKKFDITRDAPIAAAGSCFAQHIVRSMREADMNVVDTEPAPPDMPPELANAHGYGLYSARFGNIYAMRQLLQLATDAFSDAVDERDVWMKDGRYFDALRPNIQPGGFDSVDAVLAKRLEHLAHVRRMFETAQVFVLTLGLTETWLHRKTGRVYPTAPGTIAGAYDPAVFAFRNFGYEDVYVDLAAFRRLVRTHNPEIKFLLTVSPVPLTATATKQHVLPATIYGKSVLRAVAGRLADANPDVDYFPAYEIIANPWSSGRFYEPNLRSVTPEGIDTVMRTFFAAHDIPFAQPLVPAEEPSPDADRRRGRKERRAQRRGRRAQQDTQDEDAVCEDVLLDAFSR